MCKWENDVGGESHGRWRRRQQQKEKKKQAHKIEAQTIQRSTRQGSKSATTNTHINGVCTHTTQRQIHSYMTGRRPREPNGKWRARNIWMKSSYNNRPTAAAKGAGGLVLVGREGRQAGGDPKPNHIIHPKPNQNRPNNKQKHMNDDDPNAPTHTSKRTQREKLANTHTRARNASVHAHDKTQIQYTHTHTYINDMRMRIK